jgi:hypothetical protein
VTRPYPARYPYARHTEPEQPIDPLTDSAVHRLGLGTLVVLHTRQGEAVTVGLLAIRDVSNWADLVEAIIGCHPIEVLSSRRRIFVGGVVWWAEVLSDPLEQVPDEIRPPT